ncbi:hypothetical protein O1611_g9542 [Lasiodiplodia mahajangana]|uniref:Uncharacterized protein n=1 Tax=Lasiodiplodia mahajangana TaxID=1108764 RepID=A0ACC2J809_9PEZI|nr:hypothetical protein O1611_g9542 [Lasiodiplodia mahajangana]
MRDSVTSHIGRRYGHPSGEWDEQLERDKYNSDKDSLKEKEEKDAAEKQDEGPGSDEDAPGEDDVDILRNKEVAHVPATRYPCPSCKKLYKKKSVVATHVLDRHVGTKCYWPGCGFTTATEAELCRHFCKHQRDAVEKGVAGKKCPWPDCPKTFSRGDSVQRCVKRHNIDVAKGP